jgi:hypothetical protein
MALKRKITKAEFDKLSEAIKLEYIEDGDSYRLDVDGGSDEDTGALKRAKDREVQLRKEAEKKARELEDRLGEIEGDDARKKGDIATLEKSWQSKLEKQREEYDAKLSKLTGHTTKSLVDNVAMSIAAKLSKAPSLLLPHIKARLQADFEGDEPRTRVLDRDGKPSALTIEELEKEFVANADFSAIMIGSKATGGAGGKQQQQQQGGAGLQKDVNLAKAKPSEIAAMLKAAREGQA